MLYKFFILEFLQENVKNQKLFLIFLFFSHFFALKMLVKPIHRYIYLFLKGISVFWSRRYNRSQPKWHFVEHLCLFSRPRPPFCLVKYWQKPISRHFLTNLQPVLLCITNIHCYMCIFLVYINVFKCNWCDTEVPKIIFQNISHLWCRSGFLCFQIDIRPISGHSLASLRPVFLCSTNCIANILLNVFILSRNRCI
jgi:hypothetical protein